MEVRFTITDTDDGFKLDVHRDGQDNIDIRDMTLALFVVQAVINFIKDFADVAKDAMNEIKAEHAAKLIEMEQSE